MHLAGSFLERAIRLSALAQDNRGVLCRHPASRPLFCSCSLLRTSLLCMVEGDMGRRTMVVKCRRERRLRSLYTPCFLQVCLISHLRPLCCFLCSQSFNWDTAATVTANDYHNVHARCGAEGHPEEVNALCHPHRFIQADKTLVQ